MIPPTCISHWFAYLLCNYIVPVGVESTTENTDGYEDSDWLHRNSSYKPMQAIDKDNICTILVFFVPNTNYFFLCLYDVEAKVNISVE